MPGNFVYALGLAAFSRGELLVAGLAGVASVLALLALGEEEPPAFASSGTASMHLMKEKSTYIRCALRPGHEP